jgi:hypothetical protein
MYIARPGRTVPCARSGGRRPGVLPPIGRLTSDADFEPARLPARRPCSSDGRNHPGDRGCRQARGIPDGSSAIGSGLLPIPPGAIGVLMGFDFHVGPDGPKLIEINTNAGGALVNAFVARAQKACCAPVEAAFPGLSAPNEFEASFLRSFHSEWRRQKDKSPLKSIAIVDDDPEHQYLYPEFVLFERMFKRHGLEAIITPPQKLEHRGGRLMYGDLAIDLVYNRLTDFSLEAPGHGAILTAYLSGDAVITPNPWAHAMFADKGNLVRLSTATTLRDWGVPEEKIRLLADGIPRTTFVTKDQAEALWATRSRLFFKPAAGYGGKAAYRGE